MRNLHDIHGTVKQVFASPVDFETIEIFDRCIPGLPDENPIKIGFRITDVRGEILNGQLFAEILIHIINHRIDLRTQIIMRQPPRAERLQKEKRPQEMGQTKIRITDVFLGKLRIKRRINFFEKIQAVFDARLFRRFDRKRQRNHPLLPR